MKRLLAIFLALSMVMPCFAMKYLSDLEEELCIQYGYSWDLRYEWSSELPVALRWKTLQDGTEEYALFVKVAYHFDECKVTCPCGLREGRALLLKLGDDSIIELKNKKHYYANRESVYRSKFDKERIYFMDCYFIGVYPITREELDRMISQKVVKMRVENDVDLRDWTLGPRDQDKFNEDLKGWVQYYDNKKSGKSMYNDF